jgi:hypothetical protein
MSFCYSGIETLCGNAALREFGICPAHYESDAVFVLQHRALDADALPLFTEFPMSFISELLLDYCPWCGVDRRQFYCNRLSELDKSELKLEMGR